MVSDHLLDTSDFSAPEAAAVRKAEWTQPNLRHAVLTLYVYVRRLREEEAQESFACQTC